MTSAYVYRCRRCGGTMAFRRELEGTEWYCITCGHVDYGAGFTAIDFTEGKEQRGPRTDRPRGKVKLMTGASRQGAPAKTCLDCGKGISQVSVRCRKCHARHRRTAL